MILGVHCQRRDILWTWHVEVTGSDLTSHRGSIFVPSQCRRDFEQLEVTILVKSGSGDVSEGVNVTLAVGPGLPGGSTYSVFED